MGPGRKSEDLPLCPSDPRRMPYETKLCPPWRGRPGRMSEDLARMPEDLAPMSGRRPSPPYKKKKKDPLRGDRNFFGSPYIYPKNPCFHNIGVNLH